MGTAHGSHRGLSPLRFISVEAASGLVLLAAAALALACANSPLAATYQSLWDYRIDLHLPFLPVRALHFWVNDGLMTIFFLLVGLEIRREIHDGTLSDPRIATLPVIAAAGGVVVPALIYLLVSAGPQLRRGWAIPTATDIAFAVGVLSLIGRVPRALRMLLLTLAIADDVAAIVVIAVFYSGGLVIDQFLVIAGGVALVLLLQALGVRPALAYVLPAVVLWLGMLRAGVHPALAGVLLGLLTPVSADFGLLAKSTPVTPPAGAAPRCAAPLERVEALLHPYVAFGIMPLFAFANAGVRLDRLDFSAAPLAVGSGIVLGLVLGKPLGIVLGALAAVALKIARLPAQVRWPDLLLLGVLGGIGFTMSVFIADLAFDDPRLLTAAKFAVLLGSGIAAALALTFGRLHTFRRAER